MVKMKLMKYAVLVAMASSLVFLVGCSSFIVIGTGDGGPDKEVFVDGIRDVIRGDTSSTGSLDSTEIDYYLSVLQMLEIVDNSLFQIVRCINLVTRREVVDSLIDDFLRRKDFETRPDTPDINEWWLEMQKRMASCDSMGFRYYWPSGIWAWDIRARFVLKLGVPAVARWVDEGNCFGSDRGLSCTRFLMEWDGPPYRKIYFEDNFPGRHPYRHVPMAFVEPLPKGSSRQSRQTQEQNQRDAEMVQVEEIVELGYIELEAFTPFPKAGEVIKARVAWYGFPNSDDSTSSLWFVAMVRGDQITWTGDASDSTFYLEGVVYDLDGGVVYQDTSRLYSLTVPAGVNKKDIWYTLCLGGVILPGGKYEAILTFKQGFNLGQYRVTVSMPTERATPGLSDIVIFSDVWREGKGNLLEREGGFFRPDLLDLSPGKEFSFYLELEAGTSSSVFEVWGYLHPIMGDSERDIFSSPPRGAYNADVYEKQRRWHSFSDEDHFKEYEKWSKEREEKEKRRDRYTVYSPDVNDFVTGSITRKVFIPDDLPSGLYSFVIQIKDHTTGSGWMSYCYITVR